MLKKLKGPFLTAEKADVRAAAKAVERFWKSLPPSSHQRKFLNGLGDNVREVDFVVSQETAVSSSSGITGSVAVAVSVGDNGSSRSITVPGYYVVKLGEDGKPVKTEIELVER